MLSVHEQLQKERSDGYGNGLYAAYRFYVMSTVNNLCNNHLDDFQITCSIREGAIPAGILPKPPGQKVRNLILFIKNRFTPNWLLDHVSEATTVDFACDLHEQMTRIPLRDIYRIGEWSGKVWAKQKEQKLAEILSIPSDDVASWCKQFIPEYQELRPFKHGNHLVLYGLLTKALLKGGCLPVILQKDTFAQKSGNQIAETLQLLLSESEADIGNLRFFVRD